MTIAAATAVAEETDIPETIDRAETTVETEVEREVVDEEVPHLAVVDNQFYVTVNISNYHF